jgi:hypothetical protein
MQQGQGVIFVSSKSNYEFKVYNLFVMYNPNMTTGLRSFNYFTPETRMVVDDTHKRLHYNYTHASS